ncbi:hypothetical protein B0H14DRAFT_1220793 [Mycena olivaceomarginata]|nr:hypothetical protein B0H14DRAFT_1220793 [Mycena olivaceomarginata]
MRPHEKHTGRAERLCVELHCVRPAAHQVLYREIPCARSLRLGLHVPRSTRWPSTHPRPPISCADMECTIFPWATKKCTLGRPARRCPLPTQMPNSLLSTWQSLRTLPGPILARYHVDSWSTRTVSIPHRPSISHLRPILLHSGHSMSCPPPAPRFRYAAMPLSADCTATPFRPTFVASVSISSLALHTRLHPLSCRFSCLPRAVLLDWIRRC